MVGLPKWATDEWIVALDFYLRHGGRIPSKGNLELKALSRELRRLCGVIGSETPTLRNVNGVHMQLMALKKLDPEYRGRGLHVSPLAREVWGRYAHDPDMTRRLAEAIRRGMGDLARAGETERVEDIYGVTEAREGAILTRQHVLRERRESLVKRKKAEYLKSHNSLPCEVCAFDYFEAYGPHGSGYIECHHVKPLSSLSSPRMTRLADLVLICASCHRMIHRKREWLEVGQLREMWRGGGYGRGA